MILDIDGVLVFTRYFYSCSFCDKMYKLGLQNVMKWFKDGSEGLFDGC